MAVVIVAVGMTGFVDIAVRLGFTAVFFFVVRVAGPVTVVLFSGQAHRVYMHRGVGQIFQVMEQPVVHVFGDIVPYLHREAAVNGDVDFRQHRVPQPAYPDLGNLPHAIGERSHVPDLVWNLGFDAVQQA